MHRISTLRITLIAGCVVVGALLLLLSDMRSQMSAPTPAILPFPPTGGSVAEAFSIGLGGRFEVHIVTGSVTASRIEGSRSGNPVHCSAVAVVIGEGVRVEERLDALHAFDWTQRTVTWNADGFIPLPRRGNYVLSISDNGCAERVFMNGAVVELVRVETNGADFLPFILAAAAYFLLSIALLVLVLTAARD